MPVDIEEQYYTTENIQEPTGKLLNEIVNQGGNQSGDTPERKSRFLSRRQIELAAPKQAFTDDGTYHYDWRTKWGNQVNLL